MGTGSTARGYRAAIASLPVLKRLYPSVRRRIAKAFWPDGRKIVTSRGARFEVDYRDFVDRQIAFFGGYEDAQLDRHIADMDRVTLTQDRPGHYVGTVSHKNIAKSDEKP